MDILKISWHIEVDHKLTGFASIFTASTVYFKKTESFYNS